MNRRRREGEKPHFWRVFEIHKHDGNFAAAGHHSHRFFFYEQKHESAIIYQVISFRIEMHFIQTSLLSFIVIHCPQFT